MLPSCLAKMLAPFTTNVVASCIIIFILNSKKERYFQAAWRRCWHPSSPILLLPTYPHPYLNLKLISSSTPPCSDVHIPYHQSFSQLHLNATTADKSRYFGPSAPLKQLHLLYFYVVVTEAEVYVVDCLILQNAF